MKTVQLFPKPEFDSDVTHVPKILTNLIKLEKSKEDPYHDIRISLMIILAILFITVQYFVLIKHGSSFTTTYTKGTPSHTFTVFLTVSKSVKYSIYEQTVL